MSLSERNAKIYGAVETETFITFEGFCKKIYNTEQQKVEVFIDDKKVDTILANQKISTIEDTYEVFDTEGFCFSYKLPEEYIGEKHKLEFKTVDGEQLIHSPFSTINVSDEKYNEYCFLESLNEPIDKEKIKNICGHGGIGFMANKENLENLDFLSYINELGIRNIGSKIKVFYFTLHEKNKLEQKFDNLNHFVFIKPQTILDIINEVEVFLFSQHKRDNIVNVLWNKSDSIYVSDYCNLYNNVNVYDMKDVDSENIYQKYLAEFDIDEKLKNYSKNECQESWRERIIRDDKTLNNNIDTKFRITNAREYYYFERIKNLIDDVFYKKRLIKCVKNVLPELNIKE